MKGRVQIRIRKIPLYRFGGTSPFRVRESFSDSSPPFRLPGECHVEDVISLWLDKERAERKNFPNLLRITTIRSIECIHFLFYSRFSASEMILFFISSQSTEINIFGIGSESAVSKYTRLLRICIVLYFTPENFFSKNFKSSES